MPWSQAVGVPSISGIQRVLRRPMRGQSPQDKRDEQDQPDHHGPKRKFHQEQLTRWLAPPENAALHGRRRPHHAARPSLDALRFHPASNTKDPLKPVKLILRPPASGGQGSRVGPGWSARRPRSAAKGKPSALLLAEPKALTQAANPHAVTPSACASLAPSFRLLLAFAPPPIPPVGLRIAYCKPRQRCSSRLAILPMRADQDL